MKHAACGASIAFRYEPLTATPGEKLRRGVPVCPSCACDVDDDTQLLGDDELWQPPLFARAAVERARATSSSVGPELLRDAGVGAMTDQVTVEQLGLL